MGENKYQDCYVAFLDILGFKEMLKSNDFDQMLSIFKAIKEFKPRPIVELPVYSEIKFHIMSDSIIVYVDASKTDSFICLTDVCFQIQRYLLEQEKPVLCRGGIASGKLYCEDDVIFGPGLSRAYSLENSLAVYPRIVFTGETLKKGLKKSGYTKLWNHSKMYYRQDNDKLYYIYYFHSFPYFRQIGATNGQSVLDHDNGFVEKMLDFTEKYLDEETNLSIRTKYLWLYNKIYEALEHMPETKKYIEAKQKEKDKQESEMIDKIINDVVGGNYV